MIFLVHSEYGLQYHLATMFTNREKTILNQVLRTRCEWRCLKRKFPIVQCGTQIIIMCNYNKIKKRKNKIKSDIPITSDVRYIGIFYSKQKFLDNYYKKRIITCINIL